MLSLIAVNLHFRDLPWHESRGEVLAVGGFSSPLQSEKNTQFAGCQSAEFNASSSCARHPHWEPRGLWRKVKPHHPSPPTTTHHQVMRLHFMPYIEPHNCCVDAHGTHFKWTNTRWNALFCCRLILVWKATTAIQRFIWHQTVPLPPELCRNIHSTPSSEGRKPPCNANSACIYCSLWLSLHSNKQTWAVGVSRSNILQLKQKAPAAQCSYLIPSLALFIWHFHPRAVEIYNLQLKHKLISLQCSQKSQAQAKPKIW